MDFMCYMKYGRLVLTPAVKEDISLNVSHSEGRIHCPYFMDVHINTYRNPDTKVSRQRTQETNIWFVTLETLMFKPKGRAHSNVFIHLHKHHLSRHRQLLKQWKFSGSLRASQSVGAQLWFHQPVASSSVRKPLWVPSVVLEREYFHFMSSASETNRRHDNKKKTGCAITIDIQR